MHQINKTHIAHLSTHPHGYRYPLICDTEEEGQSLTTLTDIPTDLRSRLDSLRGDSTELGYYDTRMNRFIVRDRERQSTVSLWDLAYSEQDRASLEKYPHRLIRTDQRRLLIAGYNQGLISIISTIGMSREMIEQAVEKIHQEETIQPFLLAQGLCYRKRKGEAEWWVETKSKDKG